MIKGLFYDDRAREELEGLFEGFDADMVYDLTRAAIEQGLSGSGCGIDLRSFCQALLRTASGGLQRLSAANEKSYLDPLCERIETFDWAEVRKELEKDPRGYFKSQLLGSSNH